MTLESVCIPSLPPVQTHRGKPAPIGLHRIVPVLHTPYDYYEGF
jgi:hypothetical protein